MGKGNWGREPFDLRMTVLRMLRRLPMILTIIVVGMICFGGGYLVKTYMLQPDPGYSASAVFFTEYSDPDWFVKGIYINDYSWNIWLESDELIGYVNKYLPAPYAKEELANMLEAKIYSDLRVMEIFATTDDPSKADAVIEAVKKAITIDFPAGVSAVDEVRVTDTKAGARVVRDIRPVRAFVLGAVLSTFLAIIVFLLVELSEDSIWLPATLGARYGLKQPGVPGTDTFAENIRYFFEGKKQIALCPVETEVDPMEVAKYFQQQDLIADDQEFLALPSPVLSPEVVKTLRDADGIMLICRAGSGDARNLEFLLDFLEQQDCKVTAAILWEPDMWLLKNYYRFEKQK